MMKRQLVLFLLLLFFGFSEKAEAAFCSTTYGSVANAICGAPTVTVGGACVTGSNAGVTACLTGGCASGTSQYFLQFTATSPVIDITLNSTGIQSADLALISNGTTCPPGSGYSSACPAQGSSLCIMGCNTSVGAGSVTVTGNYLVPGQTYYLMVESSSANQGSFSVCATTATAGGNDCNGGSTICSDANVSGNSSGSGAAELTSTTDGCLAGEHQSSWYLFSPSVNGSICFNIVTTVDYDFAIWGPYASGSTAGSICPPSGAPIRCTFDAGNGNTGLSPTQSNVSEGATGGNGFVSCINATAGEVYAMVIDNFTSDGTSFTLDWTGTASLNCMVLPIELKSFTGKHTIYGNQLEWITASEVNTRSFIIERSIDGMVFTSLADIPASGNSNTEMHYSYTDEDPGEGISYYRIRQIDIDGKFSYTYQIAIKSTDNLEGFRLSQNPVNGQGSFYIHSGEETEATIIVYDMQGRQVFFKSFSISVGENSLPFDFSSLQNGYYTAVLNSPAKASRSRFLKN